ncbi:MAG TPA: hypothetical protein VJT73_15935 [Polyangiaceae bacterium]|nr:hypothetical protein [Polyangiaceae bacterium]
MRSIARTYFFLGTCVVMASFAAIQCGGDGETTPPGTSTGAAGSAGSATTTGAGENTGGANAGGSSTGGANTGGTNTSGTNAGGANTDGSATGGAAGIKSDSGGPADSAIVEAGSCPASPPAEDTPCAARQICHYAMRDCACSKKADVDAARGWVCEAFEAGAPVDSGACSSAPVDGKDCSVKGERCHVGDAGERCICVKNTWNCP